MRRTGSGTVGDVGGLLRGEVPPAGPGRPMVSDRAAMIEAASRSLRLQQQQQQLHRLRGDRPRSKGSVHDGADQRSSSSAGGRPPAVAGAGWPVTVAAQSEARTPWQGAPALPPGGAGRASSETAAQRRIRSVENEQRREKKPAQPTAVEVGGGHARASSSASGYGPSPSNHRASVGATSMAEQSLRLSDASQGGDRDWSPLAGQGARHYSDNTSEELSEDDMGVSWQQSGGAAPPVPEDNDVPRFPQDLKRPLSRKKDPSASAAAGLGAFSSPARPITDAFEQRKTRQPIPVESWGPRPPSRHGPTPGLPPKAAPLNDAALDEETRHVSAPSRARPNGSAEEDIRPGSRTKVVSDTWAAARAEPSSTSRGRGRERKASNREQDLGIVGYGAATRQPNVVSGQLGGLSKAEMAVLAAASSAARRSPLAAEDPEYGDLMLGYGAPWPPSPQVAAGAPAGTADRSSPLHAEAVAEGLVPDEVAPAGPAPLLAAAMGVPAVLGTSPTATSGGAGGTPLPWASSPAGGGAGSVASPQRQKGRQSLQTADSVRVEDIDAADLDFGGLVTNTRSHGAYRREATPPQVIVTRSQGGHANKSRAEPGRRMRGEQRSNAHDRHQERNQRERGGSMPFSTSLDVDFLSLFAT
eukprot:TRINITY_DN1944_c2_g1_i1.p1 TRINITY_DN1944_c2_g1~~TRINITY_DN1944_c2_g1_i1.p1  ORF type:complete len:642 (+),score=117.98 TRINITY_DN1944_c2_g1_i1:135-2060(+)